MTKQEQAQRAFCTLAKDSQSSSVYLLMRLGDLLYRRYDAAVLLRDAWSIKDLTEEQAGYVIELIPELEDGGGGVSSKIQDSIGF